MSDSGGKIGKSYEQMCVQVGWQMSDVGEVARALEVGCG